MALAQPITPCLWFDDRAEEAAQYHIAIFKKMKKFDIADLKRAYAG